MKKWPFAALAIVATATFAHITSVRYSLTKCSAIISRPKCAPLFSAQQILQAITEDDMLLSHAMHVCWERKWRIQRNHLRSVLPKDFMRPASRARKF